MPQPAIESSILTPIKAPIELHDTWTGITSATQEQIKGRYSHITRLGKGRFAAVLKARSKSCGQWVAIKVTLAPEHYIFHRHELAKLLFQSPQPSFVVRLQDAFTPPGNRQDLQPFLVLELVDGQSLGDFVRGIQDNERGRALRLEIIVALFRLYHRLHNCHMVHGDVSPRNIMVDQRAGGELQLKLIDFGAAHGLVQATSTKMAGEPIKGVATPGCVPHPESNGEYSVATELPRIAAVAFFVLTGEFPQGSRELEHLDRQQLQKKGLPRTVQKIILKALRGVPLHVSSENTAEASDQPAKKIADSLVAWQTNRQLNRHRLVQLAILIVVAAIPAAIGWQGWQYYWDLAQEQDSKKWIALQLQVAKLPSDPPVAKLLKEADSLNAQRDTLIANRDAAEAAGVLRQVNKLYEQAIQTSAGFERARPLRKSLADILLNWPWVVEAKTIRTRAEELKKKFETASEQVDGGDTESGWKSLLQVSAEVSLLIQENQLASNSLSSRLATEKECQGVSSRLQGLEGYAAVKQTSEQGAACFDAGNWKDAASFYGHALQLLHNWLPQHETADEKRQRTSGRYDELTALIDAQVTKLKQADEQLSKEKGKADELRRLLSDKSSEQKPQTIPGDSNGVSHPFGPPNQRSPIKKSDDALNSREPSAYVRPVKPVGPKIPEDIGEDIGPSETFDPFEGATEAKPKPASRSGLAAPRLVQPSPAMPEQKHGYRSPGTTPRRAPGTTPRR